MKKINILHIAFVDSRCDSGISVVVPKHLEHQSKYANVTLLNLYNYIPKNAENNYNVIYAKNISTLCNLINNINHFDLVVFHEIYRPYFIKAYKKLLKKGVPYIIIPHGSLTKKAQLVSKQKKQLGNQLFFNRFIKFSSNIQYMSDEEKEQSIVSNHKHFVQGSGIDIIGHKKDKFSKIGLKVIYIGRLDVNVKGLDILLDAASDNKNQFIKNGINITIAGSDSKGGRQIILKSIEKFGLEDIVKLEGPIYGKEKITKLLKHDIFAQLSRTEAQCLGLMEAMDLGIPSIVSPGSTFFELAKKHNIAIPCIGNSHNVAEALLEAIQDKNNGNLSNMSRRSSQYINKNFNWDKVSHSMIRHYKYSIDDWKKSA